MTVQQMRAIHTHLIAQGFPVEITYDDQVDVPYTEDGSDEFGGCPQWCRITWGDLTLYDDGHLTTDDNDGLAVNVCDIATFVREIHTAWHAATDERGIERTAAMA